jgi:dihydrofolate reductase
MRTVTYGAACSLDGFITAADGALDWLHFSGDVQEQQARYWAGVDTILMGRKTFEVALAMTGGGSRSRGASASKGTRGSKRASRSNPFAGLTSYVFSHTLDPADHPDVTIVADDAGAFVRELKGRPGRGICMMGGGELARSLLAADVIDEVGLNIHPILLGAGVPLFRDPGRRVPLELTECRTLDGGCVLAIYRVKR